jgi:uncharacterized damage-inducible protein DinB
MDPRLPLIAEMLRLNSRLFHNCLDGLTDEQARQRPSDACNSAVFVAAHLVESRHYILKVLGAERENPLERYTGGWKSIEQITEWPALDAIRTAWTAVSAALGDRLAAITPAELDAPITTQMPLETRTTLGMLTFLVQHDSYHVGQLSLLRKYSGLPAMSYS